MPVPRHTGIASLEPGNPPAVPLRDERERVFSTPCCLPLPNSMVVDNLGLLGAGIRPPENDTPLVVDADRMLATQIALQCLKPVSRRHRKVAQRLGAIELNKLAPSNSNQIGRKSPWGASLDKDRFCKLAPVAADQRAVFRWSFARRITSRYRSYHTMIPKLNAPRTRSACAPAG
jgi:hypothetical protein